MLKIEKIQSGPLAENCWILRSEKEVAVIDPGGEVGKVLAGIGEMKVAWILLTHSHSDHREALAAVAEKRGGRVAIHAAEAEFIERGEANPPEFPVELAPVAVARKLAGGEVLDFDGEKIEVLHTPGHTPGSCCFLVGKHLFSGDTLFRENVGRWDLAGGDLGALKKSLAKLLRLPADLKIHPGHDRDWSMHAAKKFNFQL